MLMRVAGIIAGLVTAWAIILIVEAISGYLFPLPVGADISNIESIRAAMIKMPAGAFLFVLAGWAIGATSGGVLANWISRSCRTPGLVVGLVIFVGAILTMVILPHPIWFWALVLVVLPSSCLITSKLSSTFLTCGIPVKN